MTSAKRRQVTPALHGACRKLGVSIPRSCADSGPLPPWSPPLLCVPGPSGPSPPKRGEPAWACGAGPPLCPAHACFNILPGPALCQPAPSTRIQGDPLRSCPRPRGISVLELTAPPAPKVQGWSLPLDSGGLACHRPVFPALPCSSLVPMSECPPCLAVPGT